MRCAYPGSVYQPKTPYNERKEKSAKGSKGLSWQQREDIDTALYELLTKYGIENIYWLVSTFDESASDEALHNIALASKKIIKNIKYRLETAYKKHSIEPYIMVIGLKERTSRGKKIPCFDINIVYALKDKEGNQLLDVTTLINEIYLTISNLAKETIGITSNHYNYPINNSWEDWRKLANYLKEQQDKNLLKSFQSTEYASKLPNTWLYIPNTLKQGISDIKAKYSGNRVNELREIMRDNLSPYVTILDKEDTDYKLTAQLNQSVPREEFMERCKEELYSNQLAVIDSDLYNQSYQSECVLSPELQALFINLFGEYSRGVNNIMELSERLAHFGKEHPEAYPILTDLRKIILK